MNSEIQKEIAHLRQVITRQAKDIELLSREVGAKAAALCTEIIAREAAEKNAERLEIMLDEKRGFANV